MQDTRLLNPPRPCVESVMKVICSLEFPILFSYFVMSVAQNMKTIWTIAASEQRNSCVIFAFHALVIAVNYKNNMGN